MLRLNQRELIAAEARHRIHPANAGSQPVRECLQQQISHGMSERVVDVLEMIEIEIQNRKFLAVAFRPLDRLPQGLDEHGAIGEPGEVVVQRGNLICSRMRLRSVMSRMVATACHSAPSRMPATDSSIGNSTPSLRSAAISTVLPRMPPRPVAAKTCIAASAFARYRGGASH
jgi:hypothetical protein